MALNSASEFIRETKKSPENFYIIHYSCQSLYDDNEGLSPRITSIAITHFASEQTVSFSTHAVAEELGISRDEVRARFDEVEMQLLSQFYQFVRDRRDKYWVHWNMRNLTYGFEHIEHRYRSLGGRDASVIPVERRINLNDMIARRYGSDYAKHPKLQSLMEMNGGVHRHFLSGSEEVQAFQNNEFIRMHNSTLSKVGFFSVALSKMIRGRLQTASKGVGVALDRIFESRHVKAVALAATVIGGAAALYQIFVWSGASF